MESERDRDFHRGSGGSNGRTENGLLAELKLKLILTDEWMVLMLLDHDHTLRSTALSS